MTQDSISFLGSSIEVDWSICYSPSMVQWSGGIIEFNGKDSFRVNGYRLSHSWSHSNQKRRQSTSLNLKKPKCVLIMLYDPSGRNFKEIERKKIGSKLEPKQSKTGEKQSSAKFRRDEGNFCEMSIFVAKPFRSTVEVSASVFRSCESDLAHECHFAVLRKGFQKSEHHSRSPFVFFTKPPVQPPVILSDHQRRPKFRYPKMAETEELNLHLLRTAKDAAKGAKSRLCSKLRRRDQILSSEAGATKAAGKTIFNQVRRSAIEEETQVPSPVPSPSPLPVPSPVPSPAPQEKAQEPQAPIPEPQIQAETPLKNIQSEARACPIIPAAEEISYGASASSKRLFLSSDSHGFLPIHDNQRSQNPTLIHFILMETCIGPKEGEFSWKPYKMSEGFFFGPHHLIMAALLYFEEKVHKKKLQRADCIPLLFPRLLCQILEHLDTPLSLSWREKRICPWQPQPAARRASPRHTPEGITVATPAIPRAPPAAPASSQPTSAEPRMAIPISEYRELCRALETLTASQSNLAQELAAIKACQEQMLASQAQQAAILRQLQVHFDLPQAVEPSTDTPPEPHSQPSESHPPEPEAPADPPTEEADPSA
ncbi:hypothetical protein CK203_049714 [Vitis vinifera]|uniref:Uncharacterized protein n=1 Tax=Vitis vinifera TaxID=29760 RepID=A0A438H1A1_VITVI|nr:hypothetical protein CK203_049714 [Vitis vinifera]